jgi:hypothetical protein
LKNKKEFFKIFFNTLFIDRTRAATNIDARLNGMTLDGMGARMDHLEAQMKQMKL